MKFIDDPIISSIAILISQICFVYLRTLNVIYTSQKKMIKSIVTGNGLSLSWLFSVVLGTHSIINGEVLPIIAFLIGGTIGTYLGIKNERG